MDRLTRAQLSGLAQVCDPCCVTLLMPTHRSGRDNEQDPIRLKNLLVRAEDELARRIRRPLARLQFEPVRRQLNDSEFWLYQSDGLAIFSLPERTQMFRLPITFGETMRLGDRFYILPVIETVAGDGHFYVLALSPGSVRLLACTRDRASEVTVPDMPKDYEALGRFIEEQPQLQYHTRQAAQSPETRRGAMFHGQGEGTDKAQWRQRLGEFCTLVDRALQRVLRDETAPLVLACDVSLAGVYRQTGSYRSLIDQTVTGSPDLKTPEQLAAEAWQLVEPIVEQSKQEDIGRLQHALAVGQGSDDVESLVPAACEGRIDTLFVERDQAIWGTFDPRTHSAELSGEQPGTDDLLNLAASQTYLNGGIVYVLPTAEMPNRAPAAAIYRY